MAVEIKIPSGSKIPPLKIPVDVFEIGNPGMPGELIVHNGKIYVYNAGGQTLIDAGIIQTLGVAVGLKAWVHNIVFTATDEDTASWASGTIYFGDGSNQAINAGNTGNITAKTFVYYDETNTLKKTTNADFLDDTHVLLATIEEGAAGAKCIITVSQLPSGTISAEQVVTGFLSADRIDAGTITAGKLNVSELSAIVADLGTITAGSMSGVTLSIGTGNAIFKADANGIYLGHATFASAPFRVNMAGDLVATSVTITGQIASQAGSSYVGNQIAETYIGNLNASKITAGDISAARIQANVLSALQAEISNLSAIKADIGTINAGTITGVKIQTHSSATAGVKMLVPDYGGIAHGYLEFWDDYGDAGLLYFHKTNAEFHFEGGIVNMHSALNLHSQNIDNVREVKSDGQLTLQANGVNKVFFNSSSGGGDLSMFPYYGDFYATGTKYFKIPHPLDPKNKSIQYVSIESPEVALKIRGIGKLSNGKTTIKLPEHWILTTENKLTTIQLTPLAECNGLFAPRDKLTNKSFEVRELNNNKSNAEFSWELTATRKGYGNFKPVEMISDEAERVVVGIIESKKTDKSIHQKRRESLRKLIKRKYKEKTGKMLIDKSKKEIERVEKRRQDYIVEMTKKRVFSKKKRGE